MNWTLWTALGSFFAALGVGLGAFGAHALKGRLSIEDLAIFEVGVRYQMYHALALLAVGFVASKMDSSLIKIAGWAFGLLVGVNMVLGGVSLIAMGLHASENEPDRL